MLRNYIQIPHEQELLHVLNPGSAHRAVVPTRQQKLRFPGAHTPCPWQLPQEQLSEQVWVPQFPHFCVLPGKQVPEPTQLPQVQEVVQVAVPQNPQSLVSPGAHPWSAQVPPHWQASVQVRVPQLPQPRVSSGAHGP